MEEPPAKRAKRMDSSAMWEKEHGTPSPRSPRPHDSRHDEKGKPRHDEGKGGGYPSRKDADRRRRSKSPRDRTKRDRSRSRERSYRDHDRDRERERERGKDRRVNGHSRRDREGSRSREGQSRDHPSTRHERSRGLSRSRSPPRNGDEPSSRTRSPAQPSRTDHDRSRGKDRDRDKFKPEPNDARTRVKAEPGSKREARPAVNGDAMALDGDDEDALIKKLMGFNAFNTTHNKKVPGNQIYGVRKEKKTEYRQYMNRTGGFNRPLSPSR